MFVFSYIKKKQSQSVISSLMIFSFNIFLFAL